MDEAKIDRAGGLATGTEPIIDAWVQHPTARLVSDRMFESLFRWMRTSSAGGSEAAPPGGDQLAAMAAALPLSFTRDLLDRAGVGRALMTAWWGPRGPLISNDEVAACVAALPDRLVGVAAVDLERPMEAVRELRRAVTTLGFKAVRMLPWLWDRPPDDRRYYPIYAACVDLGVPFCTQVGHTGPLMPSEPGRPIPYLDRVALDFPELVIVGGHIGYPWTEEMIALCRKYPNVYIDTSAYKPRRYPPALVDYLRGRGRHKVLFGSNAPMITPRACLAQLDDLDLDPEARRLFLHDNAQRVFKLDTPPGPTPQQEVS